LGLDGRISVPGTLWASVIAAEAYAEYAAGIQGYRPEAGAPVPGADAVRRKSYKAVRFGRDLAVRWLCG